MIKYPIFLTSLAAVACYSLHIIKVEKADLVNFNDRFVIETNY